MQLCSCKQLKGLKVEADFSAEPLWCAHCHSNLQCEDFPLSEALQAALYAWIREYGTWIDWATDGVVEGGVALEAAHNAKGEALTELVKQELPQWPIVFSPSTYAARNEV